MKFSSFMSQWFHPISAALLRVQPVNGKISSVTQLQSEELPARLQMEGLQALL